MGRSGNVPLRRVSSPAEQAAVARCHHGSGFVAQALRSTALGRGLPRRGRAWLETGIDEVAGDLTFGRATVELVEHGEEKRQTEPLEPRHGETRWRGPAAATAKPAEQAGGGAKAQLKIVVQREDDRHRCARRGAQPEPMIPVRIVDDQMPAVGCRSIGQNRPSASQVERRHIDIVGRRGVEGKRCGIEIRPPDGRRFNRGGVRIESERPTPIWRLPPMRRRRSSAPR